MKCSDGAKTMSFFEFAYVAYKMSLSGGYKDINKGCASPGPFRTHTYTHTYTCTCTCTHTYMSSDPRLYPTHHTHYCAHHTAQPPH